MKYLVGLIAVILVGTGAVYLTKRPETKTESAATPSGTFTFDETEFDFGTVKQSGGPVHHTFTFTYEGDQEIHVTGLSASCGCTSGEIDIDRLKKGDRGRVTVTFDPNLHAEPKGKFYKTVTLMTEPKLSPQPELKIWAQVDEDLGPESFKETEHDEDSLSEFEDLSPDMPYHTIDAESLHETLGDKHFFLVDVHVPEQTHLDGTDAVIPYDRIAEHLNELPQDKDAEILLYCRSGSMSREAAQRLIDLGYKNVYQLEGGIQAYQSLY